MLNSFEELCNMRAAAVSSFARVLKENERQRERESEREREREREGGYLF